MNKPEISYTFHVQSPEDFYRQLAQWQLESVPETEPDNLNLAREMLQQIGVRCE